MTPELMTPEFELGISGSDLQLKLNSMNSVITSWEFQPAHPPSTNSWSGFFRGLMKGQKIVHWNC